MRFCSHLTIRAFLTPRPRRFSTTAAPSWGPTTVSAAVALQHLRAQPALTISVPLPISPRSKTERSKEFLTTLSPGEAFRHLIPPHLFSRSGTPTDLATCHQICWPSLSTAKLLSEPHPSRYRHPSFPQFLYSSVSLGERTAGLLQPFELPAAQARQDCGVRNRGS